MFEMAVPIQSPAICEVRSVIRFFNAKGERPAEIHKQTVAVYGNVIPEVFKTTIHEAVTEKLWYRKFCASWVPKILTDDHKTKRMGSALKSLTRYAQEGDAFLDTIVSGDETWGFHNTPESKQQLLRCKKKS